MSAAEQQRREQRPSITGLNVPVIYLIVSGGDKEGLANVVNGYIQGGFQPQGGPFIGAGRESGQFLQALVKRFSPKEIEAMRRGKIEVAQEVPKRPVPGMPE